MRFKKMIFVAVVILIAIYTFGLTIPSSNCSTIGTCRQCWRNEPAELQSELCANGGVCNASVAQQQHNAVVDVLLCACTTAKEKQYTDTNLNKEIETVLSTITGDTTITAKQVCDSPGLLLTKRQYG